MLWRVGKSILVWVVVALVCIFVGNLLETVDQEQVQTVGAFLSNYSGLLGFLAGAYYFLFKSDDRSV